MIGPIRIADVNVVVHPARAGWPTTEAIATPMSPFPAYGESRGSWLGELTVAFVLVTLEDGTVGVGVCGSGRGTAVEALFRAQVRDLVVGRDASATGELSELLERAMWHLGSGAISGALRSGIDLALHDAWGRVTGRPVYELLGGRQAEPLRPYVTSPDVGLAEALGVVGVKLPMPCGPVHGRPGMDENLRRVASARERLGPAALLAVDCYMAWDERYALEFAGRAVEHGLAWMEEPLAPLDVRGYARLRERSPVPVAAGEHTFTFAQAAELLRADAVDIVQPDLYRLGGITVARKVAAVAAAHAVKLLCHGVGLPTYHFMLSQSVTASPTCEYFAGFGGPECPWPLSGEPVPVDGVLDVPPTPGFGYAYAPERHDLSGGIEPMM